MRRALVPLFALAVVLATSACPKTSEAGLPMLKITIGDETVTAEVASTDAQRARGLMYRRDMKADRGMLFVYPTRTNLSFWMKNTFIPLTIAFIADDGTVVHLDDMAPQTTESHRSPKRVRYALEMNQGWFKEHGVEVGSKAIFQLPEGLEIQ
jgi:hypothetical protein